MTNAVISNDSYLSYAEGCYIAIMRAQTACGLKLGRVFADSERFLADEFVSAIEISMWSIKYFTRDLLACTLPCDDDAAFYVIEGFAHYLQDEIIGRLTELLYSARKCTTKEGASQILLSYLSVLGDERMQYHLKEVDRYFLNHV